MHYGVCGSYYIWLSCALFLWFIEDGKFFLTKAKEEEREERPSRLSASPLFVVSLCDFPVPAGDAPLGENAL